MDRWLAISDGANAALHAVAYAASADGPVSARAAAEAIGVSPTYLAKLVQGLARAGLVDISRGTTGGFSIVGDPAAMSALDVITAVDGGLPRRYCLFPKAACRTRGCRLKRLCDDVAARAEAALRETSIAELAGNY
jgi:Rrf2 family protein